VFLNPNGGGISLFSTSRATFAAGNSALNLAIYKNNMFEKINGEYPTFGDIIRKSKLRGDDNDKKFILIGDPALKLAYTDLGATTLKINQNIVVDEDFDTLKALQHVSVDGKIVDENGEHVNNFNGYLYPTIYDKKAEVMTFGDESSPVIYKFWKNILFNGKTAIENGKFNFDFVIPKDISYKYGKGRISYYFNDEKHDGNGYFEDFMIGGFDEQAEVDNKGPDIKLFLNDTLFKWGGITNENPVIFAMVADKNGINTTGNGIGHDIVASIDDNKELTYILNDYYESNVNRYDKGTIKYPLKNLEEGVHLLHLKVWDVYNNSSEATLKFTVINSDKPAIENLFNFPNPLNSKTTFSFSHNLSGKPINIEINIFSIIGKRVKTINVPLTPTGNVSQQIHWNGKSDSGGRVPPGVYPYNLTIITDSGEKAAMSSKLIIY
jgi:hypothetical protein